MFVFVLFFFFLQTVFETRIREIRKRYAIRKLFVGCLTRDIKILKFFIPSRCWSYLSILRPFYTGPFQIRPFKNLLGRRANCWTDEFFNQHYPLGSSMILPRSLRILQFRSSWKFPQRSSKCTQRLMNEDPRKFLRRTVKILVRIFGI